MRPAQQEQRQTKILRNLNGLFISSCLINEIKLVQLLSRFLHKKKATSKGITALSFTPEGIALAISQYTEKKMPSLIHCEFIQTTNKLSVLKELTEQHQLKLYDCYLVLNSDDYRLITIPAPAVEENELAEAIRWKISDLIEFNSEDALIDYYPLPESERANSDKMLEIIASPKSATQSLIDLCLQCGLQLQVIDIQETTLRNLAMLLPENDRGIAVLQLLKNSARIIIQQQGTLYLSRKLTTGVEHLGLNDSFLNEEQINLEQSGLALDIQRSFDYVESFYGLPAISGLAVIPVAEYTQKILDLLNNNHGITARIMDLTAIIESNILLDDQTQSLCAPVIGATLRNSIELV